MKTKIIVLLGISAIATLSFTFTSVIKVEKAKAKTTSAAQNHNNEPIGGFLSEDKF